MRLEQTIKDIKSLKIQGASAVARAGLDAVRNIVKTSKSKNRKALLKELKAAKKKLFYARETEPMLRNMLRYVLWKAEKASSDGYRQELLDAMFSLYGSVNRAKQRIAMIGKNVVKKKYTVFTHCHSSTVMRIIKSARPRHVYCTESRPRFQGRLTAKELVGNGIKTTMIVDSAVADYIKEADIVLLGCDLITPNHIVNKVGSRNISLLCEKYDIPLYVCSSSMKFDPESIIGKGAGIEERDPGEVWDKAPRKLRILNPAFDSVAYDDITSFISELGLLNPEALFITLQKEYEWMFKNV